MPELPEVETSLRGISPHLRNQTIKKVIVREPQLRWPVPKTLSKILSKHKMQHLSRRGKYILIHFDHGTLLIHLGMSGNLRIVSLDTPVQKHDHVDFIFSNEQLLRYTDPRRFGAILWTEEAVEAHPLIADLGPEPLTEGFTGEYLYQLSRNKKIAIKQFIMTSQVVVGVGNIYATESLFAAQILPSHPANRLSINDYNRLVVAIKQILEKAIKEGGTTLKDFLKSDGKPGYFKQKLQVYGRSGLPCYKCGSPLKNIKIGQRSTAFCPSCQI